MSRHLTGLNVEFADLIATCNNSQEAALGFADFLPLLCEFRLVDFWSEMPQNFQQSHHLTWNTKHAVLLGQEKKYVFTVHRPTLIFGPDTKPFLRHFSCVENYLSTLFLPSNVAFEV